MQPNKSNMLITGVNGSLGSAFKEHYHKSHNILGTTRKVLDLNNGSSVDKFVQAIQSNLMSFETIILCAGTYGFPNEHNYLYGKFADSPWRQKMVKQRPEIRVQELNDVTDPNLYDFFLNNYKVNVISQFRLAFQLQNKITDKIVFIASSAGVWPEDVTIFNFEQFQYKLQKASLIMGAKVISHYFPKLKIIILCPGNYTSKLNVNGTDDLNKNVLSMCRIIDNFKIEDSGKVFNFDGEEID